MEHIQSLSRLARQKLPSLTRINLHRLNMVISEMQDAYVNPKKYADMYAKLLEVFPEGDYERETVAARLVGCSNKFLRGSSMGCTPVCAASLLLPEESAERNSQCVSTVVSVTSSGQQQFVVELRRGTIEDENVLVYVTDNCGNFAGFSHETLDQLSTIGTFFTVFMGEDLDQEYKLLIEGKLQDLPLRNDPSPFVRVFFIIILVFIAIVCVAFVLHLTRKTENFPSFSAFVTPGDSWPQWLTRSRK
jgi:hypothetical protein